MQNGLKVLPTREQFKKWAGEFNMIPVYAEIVADLETPVSVYTKIFQQGCSCLLESVEGSSKLARYSFIAGDPFMTIKARGENLEISGEGEMVRQKGSLLPELRKIFYGFKAVQHPELPRFSGGAVGYIGYDCVRQLEVLPEEPADDLGLPDAYLIFPENVIVFDHYTSRLKIVSNAKPGSDPEYAYDRALENITGLVAAIRRNRPREKKAMPGKAGGNRITPLSSFTRKEFHDGVDTIKSHIRAGDILQAVLSQRFEVAAPAEPLAVYRALRSLNPSPYMYYLHFADLKVAGASPEMLVRLENGVVENRPIAGTRPRGSNPEEDAEMERELIDDPKERAEHVMLVDLGRNDLGRVSRFGSVQVPVFMTCEKYSHVMHLVSEVRGALADGKDAFDALAACFPAGTVSGAPKIRAMEIIDDLEPLKRGPYAGAVGYFSFSGSMDTCITIRTIVFAGGKAYAQAGAGIVADSRPDNEYEETVSKAKVLIKALQAAEEGLT